ncbi:tyrosine-type recombinase/integrase [Xanthocytophaga agilis]|uniref:Phage integrase SAM-like domain-containing protein n=1 Tax=Xanthocytophaga agilis TaxID=3048010 RepID=A0AAE3R6R2_9BACT|nr:phage integrase SAM-like domain-containing protein [Xanthocytophaga agilis]MDJ1501818.1 phage integrase SAM-like domain-containing protein [Xanthocytophaga agilis]
MPTVIFRLKYPSASESIVMLDYSYESYRLRCSSGISVVPAEFKKIWKKKQLNPSYVHNDNYQRLKRVKNIIEDFYQDQSREGVIPAPETIKRHLQRTLNMTVGQTQSEFIVRYEEYIEAKSLYTAPASVKVYRQVLNDLTAYAEKKAITLTFKKINLTFLDEYVKYLQTRENDNANAKASKGLLNDSIHKRIRNIKAFMRWAHERGYHNTTDYEKFKSSQAAKHEIVVLTEYEVELLKKADLSSRLALDRTRDLFVFAICTLQRWSDLEAFDKRDIQKDMKGNVYWEFTSVKTKKRIRVPFTGFCAPALDVLKKYDYVLPIISQQRFNEHLKELGKQLEINDPVILKRYSGKKLVEIEKPKHEFISSHMARRTGVTLLLQRGVPATTVMKLSGHSNLQTLMKYERTGDDALSEALEMASDRKEINLKKVS